MTCSHAHETCISRVHETVLWTRAGSRKFPSAGGPVSTARSFKLVWDLSRTEPAATVFGARGPQCIGLTTMRAIELTEQIHRRRAMTDRPFGVDIFLTDFAAEKPDRD